MLVRFSCSLFLVGGCLLSSACQARSGQGDGFWFSAGVSVNVGTHVDRVGIFVATSCVQSFAQFNARVAATYNLVSFGTRARSPEIQLGAGLVCAGSRQTDSVQVPFDLVCNRTGFRRCIGYAYNYYIDKSNTSQPTGTVGLQWGRVRIVTENDLFGRGHQDRYRTAACQVSCSLDGDHVLSLKTILWTGDSFDRNTVKVTGSSYPARFGYKNLEYASWGRTSLGILCLQVDRVVDVGTGNTLTLMAGIDAEQVRHVFQNRFMHDEYFVPAGWITYKNMHYPMLQLDGSPFLFGEGQEVRKPRAFLNAGLNGNLFY